MQILRNIVIFLIILTNFLFSYDFSVYERGNVQYYYVKSDSGYVFKLSEKIQPALDYYQKIFNHHLKNKIKIFFPESNDDYNKLSGGRLPEWSGAVAFPENRIIIIKPQQFIDSDKLLITIKHELIHIVVGDKYYKNNLPLWLHEGLATYLSNNITSWQEGLVLANAISANKVLELQDINQLMQFNTASANLAYLEAKIAVEFLINQIGLEKLPQFLTELNNATDQNLVFKKFLGYDKIDFEYYWYNYQKDKYKWLVVLNFENLLWISLILLAFIAFIIVKIRNYIKIKRWQTEELLNIEED